MTEKPKLVYDAPKRQHLYEWQAGEYLWASEPVFDRTREYVEVLEAENAKLRELVLCLLTCSSDTGDACDRCPVNGGAGIWDFEDFCDSLLDRVHELRIELNA